MAKVNYVLNGGYFHQKDEVKVKFYTDLYNFVNNHYDTELKSMDLNDFIESEPYIIGSLCGKYYLKEEIGGKLENQPTNYFVGYCYKNNMYLDLLQHLIEFFAHWRIIEGCSEAHADDFFASSWASLVDTAKLFKYTTDEELKNSPESPSVRCETIFKYIQNVPGTKKVPYDVNPDTILPKPKRVNYYFLGWYDNEMFKGLPLDSVTTDLTLYARWGTHTYFHSNDGYATFSDLYSDFLNDFSNHINLTVTKDAPRLPEHGPTSMFCSLSFNGKLNSFFNNQEYYDKWIWLIEYLKSGKKTEELKKCFEFTNGKFGSEAQVRWEMNSLFVRRFHLVWPKTNDYSGAGVLEKVADMTNSSIHKVKYAVGDNVVFPKVFNDGFEFLGWYSDHLGNGEEIKVINDDTYAAKIIYAKWKKS